MGFNATFNNMLVISLRSVLFVEETGGPEKTTDLSCDILIANYVSMYIVYNLLTKIGAVVAVIAWYLDLPLPIQSVSITTDVVSLNLDQSEVYNIM
jgi:hypothetical protein